MTYKKLKTLSQSELKELCEKNHEFGNQVFEAVYEENMFLQGEEYKGIFGGSGNSTFSYNDHYTSFYLRLKDPEHFICTVCPDYLCPEAQPYWTECDKLEQKWSEMTYDEQQSEEGEKVFAALEENSEKLLQAIEDQLHEYERVGEDQVKDYLERITEGSVSMSEWKTDGKAVYEEIVKIYR